MLTSYKLILKPFSVPGQNRCKSQDPNTRKVPKFSNQTLRIPIILALNHLKVLKKFSLQPRNGKPISKRNLAQGPIQSRAF